MPFSPLILSLWGCEPMRKCPPNCIPNCIPNPIFKTKRARFSPLPHPRFDPPEAGRSHRHLTADLTPVASAGSLVRMGALPSALPYPANLPAQCPTNAVNA